MKLEQDLKDELKRWLLFGSEFAEYRYSCHDEPEFYIFGRELDAARNWIARMDRLPDSEVREKLPQMVELVRSCARTIEDHGYPYLAANFEDFATNLEARLKAQLEPGEWEELIAVEG